MKQHAVIGSVASKTVIPMLTTVRVKEGQKTWKTLVLFIMSCWNPTETITGERYRTRLTRSSRALREKRPKYKQRHEKVILQHDNVRPHVAKPLKTYLEMLKWEVLLHPLYSLDIVLSNYYLFRSMAHGLADQQFCSYVYIFVDFNDLTIMFWLGIIIFQFL